MLAKWTYEGRPASEIAGFLGRDLSSMARCVRVSSGEAWSCSSVAEDEPPLHSEVAKAPVALAPQVGHTDGSPPP